MTIGLSKEEAENEYCSHMPITILESSSYPQSGRWGFNGSNESLLNSLATCPLITSALVSGTYSFESTRFVKCIFCILHIPTSLLTMNFLRLQSQTFWILVSQAQRDFKIEVCDVCYKLLNLRELLWALNSFVNHFTGNEAYGDYVLSSNFNMGFFFLYQLC